MSPESAWKCTVREYWMFMDVYMEKNGKKKSPKSGLRGIADVRELEKHLKSIGAIK
jgi:hypothetical protein